TPENAPEPQHVPRSGPAWSNAQMMHYGRFGNPFAERALASQRHHDMIKFRWPQRFEQPAQGNLGSTRAQSRNDMTDPHPGTPAWTRSARCVSTISRRCNACRASMNVTAMMMTG